MRQDFSPYLLLIELCNISKKQLSWGSLKYQILLGYHCYFQDSMC